MPLTASGRKVLASMKRQYGAKRGKSIFYASIRAKKPGSSKWHTTRTSKRRKRKKRRKRRRT